MTYALREARSPASHALAAPISRGIALIALAALELSGNPVHESVHAPGLRSRAVCDVARPARMTRLLRLAYRLQEVRPRAPSALAAPMARVIALAALAALGLSGAPFHEPFHADGRQRSMTVTERSDRNARSAPQLDDMVEEERTPACPHVLSACPECRISSTGSSCTATRRRVRRSYAHSHADRSAHSHFPRLSLSRSQSPPHWRPLVHRSKRSATQTVNPQLLARVERLGEGQAGP